MAQGADLHHHECAEGCGRADESWCTFRLAQAGSHEDQTFWMRKSGFMKKSDYFRVAGLLVMLTEDSKNMTLLKIFTVGMK